MTSPVNSIFKWGDKYMPRPRKWRKVCCLPDSNRFGPLDSPADIANVINMTVDEYETIRLIDLQGLTQEDCAIQMNISRTTVQGIYGDARKKLAESLVNGKVLWINGGEYQLCEGNGKACGGGGCRRYRYQMGIDSNSEIDEDINKIRTENKNENSNTDR